MRTLVLMIAVALVVVGAAVPADASAEGDFVSRINAERSAAGLPELQVYWDLVDDARAHARRMADAGDLHHNPNLSSVTSAWQALGENVGVGADVASLHDAFMGSSGHRGNILGDFNYVGVGVVEDGEGSLWVTAIFMRGPADLLDAAPTTTTTTTTTTAIAPPTSVPPTTTTTTAPPSPVAVVSVPDAPAVEPPPPVDRTVEEGPEPMGRPGLVHPIME